MQRLIYADKGGKVGYRLYVGIYCILYLYLYYLQKSARCMYCTLYKNSYTKNMYEHCKYDYRTLHGACTVLEYENMNIIVGEAVRKRRLCLEDAYKNCT
jgi:hypothetical protein